MRQWRSGIPIDSKVHGLRPGLASRGSESSFRSLKGCPSFLIRVARGLELIAPGFNGAFQITRHLRIVAAVRLDRPLVRPAA
ncbi:hypothetical protein SAMN05428985_110181 [Nocardioides sp. YR527]|nr:hypothetical protein SAMN05428985_110181 [Nocardioides sp. YR527]